MNGCEIVTLNSLIEGKGTSSSLIDVVTSIAKKNIRISQVGRLSDAYENQGCFC